MVVHSLSDAVPLGLVGSLNRPGGNVTGVSILRHVAVAKRPRTGEREFAPKTASIVDACQSKK